jgi:predicted Zn-dependent protease
MKYLKPIGAALSTLLLASCATTEYDTRELGEAPEDKRSSEAGIWMLMAEAEEDIKTSGARITDPALNAYVSDIACRVAGEFCKEMRVYIIDAPVFNAAMAPNGMMLVNSGLLLRAENEAEMAFVLAHEFGHYVENHSMEKFGTAKNALRWGQFFDVAALGIPIGTLAAVSSMSSHSREKETEADIVGLRQLGNNGYDTSAALSIWQNLVDEVEASGNDKKKKNFKRASIFNSHPLTVERIKYLGEEADAWSGDVTNTKAYQDITRPFLKDWLAGELANRDAGSSLQLINRLKGARPKDLGQLTYAEAEVYRFRAEDGDTELALETYIKASAYDDVPSEAFRQIGDMQTKIGETYKAVAAFERYLEVNPDAQDRALIQNIINKMKGDV